MAISPRVRRIGGHRSRQMRVTAPEGVRAAVLAHAGLTIASEWMFSPELRSAAVLSEWSLPAFRPLGRAPNWTRRTAKARAFVDFFERTISA